MYSLILASAARLLLPLMLTFSLFLLWRGHNEPGGGFVGGLVAAAAFALYALALGRRQAFAVLRVDPKLLIPAGLLTALISGLISLAQGAPFMTGRWLEQTIPVLGKVGTPLLFDIGVYIVVLGIALTIIFSLMEDDG
jgi:multicomponent Na+:H+ antiporter subunit B